MSDIAFAKGTPVTSIDMCGSWNEVQKGTRGTVIKDARFGQKVRVAFSGKGEHDVDPHQIVKD